MHFQSNRFIMNEIQAMQDQPSKNFIDIRSKDGASPHNAQSGSPGHIGKDLSCQRRKWQHKGAQERATSLQEQHHQGDHPMRVCVCVAMQHQAVEHQYLALTKVLSIGIDDQLSHHLNTSSKLNRLDSGNLKTKKGNRGFDNMFKLKILLETEP